MKLGLIGKTLGHSWSWQIHDMLIHEHYQNWELSEDEVIPFLEKTMINFLQNHMNPANCRSRPSGFNFT